mmetsp:Transcript_44798/g.115938  ORF Transcript_44798/g.115938 Transcript_44798/m.115938 type:complete len:687 (+) Transcript_44798:74-2134(+)
MGFAETVEQEPPEQYRQYYIQYRQLKRMVENLTQDGKLFRRQRLNTADLMDFSETAVGTFQELLQAELHKVNQFACVKHEALFLGLRRTCDDCKSLGKKIRGAGGKADWVSKELKAMAESIEALASEIQHLDMYVRLNYMGFQKVTELFDVVSGVSGSALFVAGLHAEAFCCVRFDDILVLLGLAWAFWRTAQSAEQSSDATWCPPESFIRNTSKYWIRPDQVVLLKTRIVKHLPYLIFGASQAEQEKLLEPFALLDLEYEGMDVQSATAAYTGTMEESQLLSSVYFDSPDGVSYQERIHREEGARLVRFRWYGENNLEDDKEIFVERKIHHEGFGSAQSAKERCIIPQNMIFEFMKGNLDIDQYYAKLAAEGVYSDKARKAMKGIAVEVDQMIKAKKLQPIIRTSYYRCAFQLATSNEVRVSLDTQMSLLDEYIPDCHPTKPWCHVASDKLSKDQVYRFPFAILEIKLQNVSETPLWLRQTLADIGAIQVHKFSKFQHAMAFLHPERVPIMPHWHADFAAWHAKKDQYAVSRKLTVNRMISSSTLELDQLCPNITTMVHPAGDGHHLKDMVNLDPKGVFANERTLLHYAEKGMYVGVLATVLLRQETPTGIAAGGALAVTTGLFYIWAVFEYYSRLGRITGRAKVGKNTQLRLDWVHGPLIIGALIMLVLAVTLVQAYNNSLISA